MLNGHRVSVLEAKKKVLEVGCAAVNVYEYTYELHT